MKNKTEQGKSSLSEVRRRAGRTGWTASEQLPVTLPPLKRSQPVGFDRYVRATPAPHAAVPLSPQHRTVLPTYAYRTVWRYNYQSGGWVPNGFAGPRR